MPICPLCDDTGILSTDANDPKFCFCAAGKSGRRQWEATQGKSAGRPPSFIDIAQLEQVNANVDAMRASLFGTANPDAPASAGKPGVVQLLYRIGHIGHEVSASEAAQLQDLARTIEGFLGDLALFGRKKS
ncbi:hypothetical protein [Tengunoibacter tsumagoiensis]|uniref:Uncharacterized protein n=1 Tax=Tengunoibacter tsumagoiensis TaxID=2014871 RepID=A0A401ZYD7_9CHLR|nr:hypothetical protein [Tengunoibacter tsumagoiensis]GCE11878.1 hypothetical protein KTT_17370 [Tengunoibacter tsumagoiensis]